MFRTRNRPSCSSRNITQADLLKISERLVKRVLIRPGGGIVSHGPLNFHHYYRDKRQMLTFRDKKWIIDF